jgi:hypothetical protein
MKQTAAELNGRLAEAEELEQAIADGQYQSLNDLRSALQKRTAGMQADLLAWTALNALLTPTVSCDALALAMPLVLH